ncbi:hypothetical protein [Fusobacterium sp. THCT1E2]
MNYKIKEMDKIMEVKFVKNVPNLVENKKRVEIKDYSKRKIYIDKEIKLSTEDFKNFSENLLTDYSFLKDSCKFIESKNLFSGSIVTDGKNKIIVETQGYDYPRYVAMI